jgi:triphosphatase
LLKAAEGEREKGYAEARRAIQSLRYSALVVRMRRWLSARSWRHGSNATRKSLGEPAVKLARRLLTKRHTAVLKLGRDFRKLSPRERHQLRIALEKLRYTVEFFRSLYRKKRKKAYFHALAQLQNRLGHMNDIVAADYLLERLSADREDQRISDHLSTAVGTVAGWHTHSASASEHEAETNWREFRRRNPFWYEGGECPAIASMFKLRSEESLWSVSP